MRRFVFIHGSSVGQTVFVPTGALEKFCNNIANKYFQGRTLRQKESGVKTSMFVEIYKTTQRVYTIYSYVNNECIGSNGREGQYFAISIICESNYIYPETLYNLLVSAYKQMLQDGKVLRKTGRETQYVISQFNEQEDYLKALVAKIEEVFDKVVSGEGKRVGSNAAISDYDSWRGYKFSLDVCNSNEAFRKLTESGRLYISEEYESASSAIDSLKKQIQRLQAEKAEIETNYRNSLFSRNAKARDEIEELNSQIRRKDSEISSLQSKNDDYEATIDLVRKELDKYERASRGTMRGREIPEKQPISIKEMVKWCLLILIFILTLISTLMNYAFFRNHSPLPEEERTGEVKIGEGSAEKKGYVVEETSLDVTPQDLSFAYNGETKYISIQTDGSWEYKIPNFIDWIIANKNDDKTLSVTALANENNEERNFTFMIKVGSIEKQVIITQNGQPQQSGSGTYYKIKVKDANGNEIKEHGTVTPGQELYASVENASQAEKGYGWKFNNCDKMEERNINDVIIAVKVEPDYSSDVIISYGNLDDWNKRKKFYLKLSR